MKRRRAFDGLLVAGAALTALALAGPWSSAPIGILALPSWTIAVGEDVEATFAVEGERARVEVLRARPDQPWSIRVMRRATIVDPRPLVLKLKVRADPPRRFQVTLGQLAAPYDTLGLDHPIDATDEWQALEIPFTPTATEPAAAIICAVGGGQGVIELEGGELAPRASP